jgi:hypothetical protein
MGNEIQAISSIAAEARSIIMPLRLALSRALSDVDNRSHQNRRITLNSYFLVCNSSDSGV